ncbi:endoplasmic reticulum junction formation protein lunapark-like [Actinia tenebrosa]|uniref:Endoplasmic reticulum junction formation protein lunapark n=1 Tax=Actinia tenebrosa TaxID=6105 RepID=A0A6P8INY7_ACTTE|nr:endoplasmic reticulum junction formation protein lunapark-like [Actinia tenebrosa]
MGLFFSRWRKRETSGEILEALQKDIVALESSQRRNEQMRKKYIGRLLIYSVLSYILLAVIFYFKYFPTNWRDRIMRIIPLLIFPLLIYGVKRLLHYIFVSRMTKNAELLEELKEKKKQTLEEVMEKETYKTAKELLEKYDPESSIIKMDKKELVSTVSPKSPAMADQATELRRRNVAGNVQSPNVSLQKATSVPSLTESLLDSPKRGPSPGGPSDTSFINSPSVQQRANSLSNLDSSGKQIPVLGPPRPPGPPKPAYPILPRERSTMDKVVEYLVGDGPSNRYALICKQCASHNGMALKEEFEYIGFRCCYCFHLNPPRKQRPTAPKLEDDPMTPGRSRKQPPPSPRRNVNEEVKQKPEESISDVSGDEMKVNKAEKLAEETIEEIPDEAAETE